MFAYLVVRTSITIVQQLHATIDHVSGLGLGDRVVVLLQEISHHWLF